MNTEKITIIHKETTDENIFQQLKVLYKKYPDEFMPPNEWKKLRLIEIKRKVKYGAAEEK